MGFADPASFAGPASCGLEFTHAASCRLEEVGLVRRRKQRLGLGNQLRNWEMITGTMMEQWYASRRRAKQAGRVSQNGNANRVEHFKCTYSTNISTRILQLGFSRCCSKGRKEKRLLIVLGTLIFGGTPKISA